MFIIELPDEDGNTVLTKAVMEVEQGAKYTEKLSSYTILAPEKLANNWPSYAFCDDEIKEVAGPARELSREEYNRLVNQ